LRLPELNLHILLISVILLKWGGGGGRRGFGPWTGLYRWMDRQTDGLAGLSAVARRRSLLFFQTSVRMEVLAFCFLWMTRRSYGLLCLGYIACLWFSCSGRCSVTMELKEWVILVLFPNGNSENSFIFLSTVKAQSSGSRRVVWQSVITWVYIPFELIRKTLQT